eukprot:TRINITY_DN1587_c0_g1_i1.p1 TRINITY_DN1587_c0_g1~~TRINITY_DN1587_c0_g1_i1.p1  ORF type:complete len:506 (+),score=55.10 TRINITY_DN1587_c0_g1_i1:43-1560(+)
MSFKAESINNEEAEGRENKSRTRHRYNTNQRNSNNMRLRIGSASNTYGRSSSKRTNDPSYRYSKTLISSEPRGRRGTYTNSSGRDQKHEYRRTSERRPHFEATQPPYRSRQFHSSGNRQTPLNVYVVKNHYQAPIQRISSFRIDSGTLPEVHFNTPEPARHSRKPMIYTKEGSIVGSGYMTPLRHRRDSVRSSRNLSSRTGHRASRTDFTSHPNSSSEENNEQVFTQSRKQRKQRHLSHTAPTSSPRRTTNRNRENTKSPKHNKRDLSPDSAPKPEEIKLEDFLNCKSKKSTWKKKWVVLENNALRMYKSQDSKKDPTIIQLSYGIVKPVTKSMGAEHIFEIQTKEGSHYYFYADKPEITLQWQNACHTVCQAFIQDFIRANGSNDDPEIKSVLNDLMQLPYNNFCADCGKKDNSWASLKFGVFICIECSGTHRSLGAHVTSVKSVAHDVWTKEQVEEMKKMGNKKANRIWEKNIPEGRSKPTPDSSIREKEAWIISKYKKKDFR